MISKPATYYCCSICTATTNQINTPEEVKQSPGLIPTPEGWEWVVGIDTYRDEPYNGAFRLYCPDCLEKHKDKLYSRTYLVERKDND